MNSSNRDLWAARLITLRSRGAKWSLPSRWWSIRLTSRGSSRDFSPIEPDLAAGSCASGIGVVDLGILHALICTMPVGTIALRVSARCRSQSGSGSISSRIAVSRLMPLRHNWTNPMNSAQRTTVTSVVLLAVHVAAVALAIEPPNTMKPLASAKAARAGNANAELVLGTWRCLTTNMQEGIQIRMEGSQDYSRDGSAIGQTVMAMKAGNAEFSYAVTSFGTWKMRKNDICETIGRTKMVPNNAAAASPKGKELQALFEAGFEKLRQKATPSCSRILKLDAKQFSSQSIDDNTLISNCSR